MPNTKQSLLTILVTALVSLPNVSSAEPAAGVAIYVGAIAAREKGISSAGLDFGADIQYLATRSWTLNPYVTVSAEKSNATSTKVSDVIGGLQFRRWFGEYYLGAHLSSHARVYKADTTGTRYSLLATGVIAGAEFSSGWGASLHLDLLEPAGFTPYSAGAAWRNAIKANLVYRFK